MISLILCFLNFHSLQFTNDLVLKEEEPKMKICLDCNEVLDENHHCFSKKKDDFFCSYKKCGSSFESPELLAEHMQNYHQPPFSFKPKSKPLESHSTPSKVVKLPNANMESLSERLLRDSLKEKDRISSLKNRSEIRIDQPNKCDHIFPDGKFCTSSFKKPSDLVRHKRTHTGEVSSF